MAATTVFPGQVQASIVFKGVAQVLSALLAELRPARAIVALIPFNGASVFQLAIGLYSDVRDEGEV